MSSLPTPFEIPARDGYQLTARLYGQPTGTVAIVNSAMGVPARFYRHYASGLAARDVQTVAWDYRGIGESLHSSLRSFDTSILEWAESDLSGVIDWVEQTLAPSKIVLLGHSVGGQMAGLLEEPDRVAGMVGFSAQSGYWRLQGGEQKLVVAAHAYLTIPVMTRMFGYAPLSRVGVGEDLPRSVGLGWARWLRHPDYLFGDPSLPLERYARFKAPILGYSFDDDKWGTARAVDSLLAHYPNVERRHVIPGEHGLDAIGHVGYFRPQSEVLWDDAVEWIEAL